jgi:dienelactone hydrolase
MIYRSGKFLLIGLIISALGGPTHSQQRYVEPQVVPEGEQAPLAGTKQLALDGDIASQMIDGVDRFLLRKLDESVEKRERHWKRDFSSPEAYAKSIEPNRKRLAHILGVRDNRVPFDAPEIVSTLDLPPVWAADDTYQIHSVRWPAFGDVHGQGLLLMPKDREPLADVVVVMHCDAEQQSLTHTVFGKDFAPYARHLTTSGCRVLILSVIERRTEAPRKINSRELLYRSAFELGRGLTGYEVQKVLAALNWMDTQRSQLKGKSRKIGIVGWGDGGMIALYAAALDPRCDVAIVSGYFDDRRNIWQEPIDRNVFGLLDQFGDAELASMVAPRRLIIEACQGPTAIIDGQGGGAPARLVSPPLKAVKSEVERARQILAPLNHHTIDLVVSNDGAGPYGSDEALKQFLNSLARSAKLNKAAGNPEGGWGGRQMLRFAARQIRDNFHELDRHNQQLLIESPYVRAEFMKKLDTSSVEAYEKSAEWYREFFATEVIGRFDDPLLPANPRSRKAYETDKWTGYEVVLDVFPDVFAYGLMLLPKDMKDGERRPVVVCQHGLEGRPQDTIGNEKSGAYSAFAARLAERGFITFAPQNLYIFRDRFRTLQRKAYPLGKTLFSIMVPQHQQITDWLKSLPFVDGERIAFYGLSYGGKSAMRIPPLVKNYCLSICSADFNEWVWKNASSRSPYSYYDKGEYEIFEFDLGSTFNYAEMAALIAPRPFMVERGHFDTVAPDETVAYEFAKVRNLYNARLKLPPDRCQIEWFVGPHTIHGVGTFEFLHKHLEWPK